MLRLYPLDGRMMDSKDALHSHLYMQFSLPAYYGRNLDALWDCLTEKEPGCILIQRADAAEKSLLLPLLGLFLDLVRETPGWSVRLSTGSPDCHENDDAPHSPARSPKFPLSLWVRPTNAGRSPLSCLILTASLRTANRCTA